MKESVYVETSVISYYTARPSRDIIVLANQEITRDWWENHLDQYKAYISQVVIDEAQEGDPEAAKRRLDILEQFENLNLNPSVEKLSQLYLQKLHLPEKAFRDSIHLAVACSYELDYLVTWNCSHIANAHIIKKLTRINRELKVFTPVICTPAELTGELL